MSRYLHHVTLTTGHTRRSWRHEIEPGLMPRLKELVATAREETGALLPGMDDMWLYITDTARCALARVEHRYPGEPESAVPIITFAVANHARCGHQLWTLLHETANMDLATSNDQRPPEPWCAVRLESGIALCPQITVEALGDMERCIAWAWLDRKIKE